MILFSRKTSRWARARSIARHSRQQRSTPLRNALLGVEFGTSMVFSPFTPALTAQTNSVPGAKIESVRTWLIATNSQLLALPFDSRVADKQWEVVLARMRLCAGLDGLLAHDILQFLQASN